MYINCVPGDVLFNCSCPNPGRREKIKVNFFFTLLCGASKGFMKALKALQRSAKIKIELNFYINATFRNAPDVNRVKIAS